MKQVRKAVIPVAGMGTRFLPATKASPKEMIPLLTKPVIQYVVEEAVLSFISQIIFITGRNKRAIEDHFDRSIELENFLETKGKVDLAKQIKAISDLAEFVYIRQKEPKGLGHAISKAEAVVSNEPFAVLLGDDLIKNEKKPGLSQLLDVFYRVSKTVIAIQEVKKEDVSKYGIVEVEAITDRLFKVKKLIEKPSIQEAPSNLAIIGRYVFTPTIFEYIKKTPKGSGGEIQITDAMNLMLEKEDIYAYKFEGKRFDTGNIYGFLHTLLEYALDDKNISDYLKDLMKELLKNRDI